MWHCFCNTRRLFLLHSSTSSDEAFLPDVTPLGLSPTPGVFVLSKYSQDWMKLRTHFTWAKEPQPSHRGQTIDDRGQCALSIVLCFFLSVFPAQTIKAGWVANAREIPPWNITAFQAILKHKVVFDIARSSLGRERWGRGREMWEEELQGNENKDQRNLLLWSGFPTLTSEWIEQGR